MEEAQTRTQPIVAPPAPGRTVASSLLWEAASLSDVGSVRSENQDACAEARDEAGNLLLIVADGMGGHAGGATASRICVETVCREFRSSQNPVDERLRNALELANVHVHEAASRDASLEGMGTTAVALTLATDGTSFVAWVGDSRGYRLRSGELERVTEDHSWVAEAVRRGTLSEDEAATHPRKNQLLRCIGAEPGVAVDLRPVDVRPGDRFLLCSDGLWGEVAEPDLAAVLGYEVPSTATRTLIDRANAHGGPDNITAQILALSSGDRSQPVPPGGVSEEKKPSRMLIRLASGASSVALLLLVLGGYAVLRGGGGFGPTKPTELAARPDVPQSEDPESANPKTGATVAAGETQPDPLAAGIADSNRPADVTRKTEPEPATDEKPIVTVPLPPEPEMKAAPPAKLEPRIKRFLDAWAKAVTTADYAVYNRIGLPGSREQFERRYANRRGVLMSLKLLDHQVDSDGLVRARVHMNYSYDALAGRRELDSDYKVLLRETKPGLRYAGRWD